MGEAAGSVITMNRNVFNADNKKLKWTMHYGDLASLAIDTISHETSHIVNNDVKSGAMPTFKYLNAEFRAWYVGTWASSGKLPTTKEAVEQWKMFLTPSYQKNAYWTEASGALNSPDEAAKIYDELSKLTGVPVNHDNYEYVINHPHCWKQPAGGPAAVVPPGNLEND